MQTLASILTKLHGYEMRQLDHNNNTFQLLCLKPELLPNNSKLHVELKCKSDGQLIISMYALGPIHQGDYDYKKFEKHAATCNKKYFAQFLKLFWVHKNKNFGIMKTVPIRLLKEDKQMFVNKEMLKNLFDQLVQCFVTCIKEALNDNRSGFSQPSKLCTTSITFKKKIQTLEFFKYKF